ncbi:MAG: isochorismatase family cysteine hydrolase [Anaerolineae bacterium]
MHSHVYSEDEVLALARQAYQRGQAKFEIVPDRCALLVIDMQDDFVKPGWTAYWVPEATRIVPDVAEMIAACRELSIPIIYTAFAATHRFLDRPRSGAFMPNRYAADGDDSEWFRDGRIWHELSPGPEDIIIFKPSYGAFYDTPLETILRNLGRDTIIITGTLTNFCCGTTARQGYERGFQVVFGSDLTATDDPDLQEAELCVLRKGFARVMTAQQILANLRAE